MDHCEGYKKQIEDIRNEPDKIDALIKALVFVADRLDVVAYEMTHIVVRHDYDL